MKLIISSSELLKGVMAVSKAIPTKSPLQILENFLFDLKGKTLEITASDTELTLKTKIEVEETAEEGSTLICCEVSRLSRSTQQLCEIIEIVKEKKLKLIIKGSITVDCTLGRLDPMSNAFIQMSGVFAELELGMIRDRVRSGMANAKAKGARIGRPPPTKDDIPQVFYRHYPAYKNKQLNVSELARVCDMSRTTVYKYIKIQHLEQLAHHI